MIKTIKVITLLLITFQIQSCAGQSTVVEGYLETVVTKPIDYYLYYPEDYEVNKNKKYGILLFLHGSGSIPGKGQEKMAPPDALVDGTEYPFLILVPQLQEPTKMWNTAAVMQLLDTVIAQHRIDDKKIYVSGLSRGGAAAWNLAIEYPDKFAALAVVCGMAPTPYAHWIDKSLPIKVFHGKKDAIIPYTESEEMVNRLKSLGYNVSLTSYENYGHAIWDVVYKEPKLYEWFNKQKKM
ncbi:alpha/beta fold hydrolase [Cellulophaga sp. HaHaR_3_176]|uniref:carboxylesterase family protein n=1 Tax=Cellulophaga sp. HaHaR_3_176 TaxID=1942464 RepID=UPI001C1F2927|nr:alpha/beta fold hydrolase [Cellulophaga sp. HaHaR_3_176]QWX84767.1 alpha/beta fold hydrolase [Cellulophaga sp. HaHaR_3_176]